MTPHNAYGSARGAEQFTRKQRIAEGNRRKDDELTRSPIRGGYQPIA